VAGFLADLIRKVSRAFQDHVHRQTKVVEFAGHVGKFHTVIEEAGSKKTLDHGVVVLATGAANAPPSPTSTARTRRCSPSANWKTSWPRALCPRRPSPRW